MSHYVAYRGIWTQLNTQKRAPLRDILILYKLEICCVFKLQKLPAGAPGFDSH